MVPPGSAESSGSSVLVLWGRPKLVDPCHVIGDTRRGREGLEIETRSGGACVTPPP